MDRTVWAVLAAVASVLTIISFPFLFLSGDDDADPTVEPAGAETQATTQTTTQTTPEISSSVRSSTSVVTTTSSSTSETETTGSSATTSRTVSVRTVDTGINTALINPAWDGEALWMVDSQGIVIRVSQSTFEVQTADVLTDSDCNELLWSYAVAAHETKAFVAFRCGTAHFLAHYNARMELIDLTGLNTAAVGGAGQVEVFASRGDQLVMLNATGAGAFIGLDGTVLGNFQTGFDAAWAVLVDDDTIFTAESRGQQPRIGVFDLTDQSAEAVAYPRATFRDVGGRPGQMVLGTNTGEVWILDTNDLTAPTVHATEQADARWAAAAGNLVLASVIENHLIDPTTGPVGGFSGFWPNRPLVGGDHLWLPGVNQLGAIELSSLQ